jgi:hypothetical protein
MSDFLTSLVARSFGTAPVIRPRVTSLFEPVRTDVAAQLRDSFGGRRGDTVEVRDEEVIGESAESRRAERPTPSPAKIEAHRVEPVADEVRLAHIAAPAIPRLVPEPEPTAITEKIIEKTELRDWRNTRPPADDVDHFPRPTANNREAAAVPSRDGPASGPPVVSLRVSEKEKPGQLIPPKVIEQMRLPDLAVSAKPQRRRGEARDFTSGVSHEPEPTVHVTIGRLEVRATKESSHPARPSSASPVMSLDEYLRKRAHRVGQ